MNDQIVIAQATHLSALLSLEKECFASDRLTAGQYRKYLQAPNAAIYCYTRAGNVLASALVLTRKNSRIARLYSFAVAPNVRRQGIAEQLYQHIEHAFTQQHFKAIKLEVRQDNLPAQRFYQRMGFEIVGEYLKYYEDGEAAFRMLKTLNQMELK